MSEVNEKAVKRYYDQNTKWFLKFGQEAHTASIHQPLWADGVDNLKDALNYANKLLLKQIQKSKLPVRHVLDLGCGVGSSIIYLARHSDVPHFTGITISAAQQELGQQHIEQAQLQDRCKIMEASFLQLPTEVPTAEVAYAIEAFVHATDALAFFREAASKLPPGGRLILIDDFLTEVATATPEAQQVLSDFRFGWHLGSLLSIATIQEVAVKAGFTLEEESDLTNLLNLNRFRDKLLAWYVYFFRPFLKSSLYFQSLIGGDARYQSLRKGWIKYRMLVFTKG